MTVTSVPTALDTNVRVGEYLGELRNLRQLDGTRADLTIGTGPQPAPLTLDATGWRIIPAASEPHAHLDKAYSAQRFDYFSGTEPNSLESAISQWGSLLPDITQEDIARRALAALKKYVSHGITAVRTHVDFPQQGDPLRGIRAIAELKDALAGILDIQIVGLAGHHTPDSVVREAIDAGMTHIGGCPHVAPDPHAQTTRFLDLVEDTGLPIDLHTDEQLSTHQLDLENLAQQVISRGITTHVTASHNVRLGQLEPTKLARVLGLVKQANIGLVTLPITNLYLQAREFDTRKPRGLPPLTEILAAGIPLAAGADNLRDPFNPAGTADPFETTSLLMTAGHLAPAQALAAVTTGARAVLGLPPVLGGSPAGGSATGSVPDSGSRDGMSPAGGLPTDRSRPVPDTQTDGPLTAGSSAMGEFPPQEAGAEPDPAPQADFILVPDTDLGEVLAGAVHTRIVVHKGRIVSVTQATERSLIA